MALETGNKDQAANVQKTADQQQATQQHQANAQAGGPVGLANIANTRRQSLGPAGGSVAAKELHKHFEAIITASGSKNCGTLLFDSEQNSVKLSAVVVLQKHQQDPSVIAYHTIVIDSGVELQPREIHLNGFRNEVASVAGDVYARSDVYRQRVKDLVIKTTGATKVLNTGCSVLPTGINKDDESLFQNLLHRATEATQNKLDKASGVKSPFTLTQARSTDQVIGVINPIASVVKTTAGLPIRSDLNIQVQVTDSNASDPYCGNVSDLSRLDCFVTLMPRVKQQQNQFLAPGQQQPQDLLTYEPRMVATAANTMSPAITLEQILLSIHSSTLLSINNSWMMAFRPSLAAAGKGKIDLRDIGAVGYEVNLTGDPAAKPAAITTKCSGFEPTQAGGDPLVQLLSAVVSPDLYYSMDIPADGDISWLTGVFAAAANKISGDAKAAKVRQKAIESIVAAADHLTGGAFSVNFPAGAEIAIMEDCPIHMGYYVDSNGEKKDLRELDYLAMLNLTGKHGTAAAHKFASTFLANGQPWPQRLAERLSQMKELLPNLKVTGYANRVTFTPQFLTALAAAIASTNMVLSPQNLYQAVNGGLIHHGMDNMAMASTTYTGGFQAQAMGGGFAGSGFGVL